MRPNRCIQIPFVNDVNRYFALQAFMEAYSTFFRGNSLRGFYIDLLDIFSLFSFPLCFHGHTNIQPIAPVDRKSVNTQREARLFITRILRPVNYLLSKTFKNKEALTKESLRALQIAFVVDLRPVNIEAG